MDFKSEASFKWLYSQNVSKVKDIARIVQASQLWNENNDYITLLKNLKSVGSWNEDIRDTSRALVALGFVGTQCNAVEKWILSKQKDGAWNNDVYDTAYALTGLAHIGSFNPKGCKWLVDNYTCDWEHPGTTALIITAIIKQTELDDHTMFSNFIKERSMWIISKREKRGAWKTLATSNIVIQALILAGYKDEVLIPVEWILSEMNDDGSWGKNGGNINTTSLSLISLKEYVL